VLFAVLRGEAALDDYAYSFALFVHLVCLLAAAAASALAGYAALRLRVAGSAAEISRWGMLIGKVVRVFPVATIGLLGSGAYMTQRAWSWSTPWIVGGLVGLAMIVVLGSGLEAGRGRALKREVTVHGLSERARRLVHDPIAWTAKVMIWTLMLAVMFMMTTKASVAGCGAAIAVAILGGALGARPLWRGPAESSPDLDSEHLTAGARLPGAARHASPAR
jgi:hypothetical protein